MRQLMAVLLTALALPLLAEDHPPGMKFAIAIEDGDADAVKALLKSHSTETLIEYSAEHKITPLIKAGWEGHADVVTALLAAGAKVNARASDTLETALINAVSREHVEVIKLLLAAKADVTLKNKFDFNPFTIAVAAGKQEIAEMLLEAGAKVDEGSSGLTPLQFAASTGNVAMIRFLARRGANVNHGVKQGGQTALLTAIYSAQPEVVKALIELKANVNAKTKDGDTPLKAAMKGDQEDIVSLLKAAGAKE